MEKRQSLDLTVLLPTYLDGMSLRDIVVKLDKVIRDRYVRSKLKFIVIDESLGSDDNLNIFIHEIKKSQLWKNRVEVLTPPYRSGNQGAILWALRTIDWKVNKADSILAVMDSDGEDNPNDLPKLLDKFLGNRLDVVYAIRGKRKASFSFKFGRYMFSKLFRILTGKQFEGGNFSVIRTKWLVECLKLGNFTNSFAGELISIAAKKASVKCDRSPRWDGTSKTSLIGLITFGFRQLIPWSEIIAVRSFIFFIASSTFSACTSIVVFLLKIYSDFSTPAWTTLIVGFSVLAGFLTFLLFIVSLVLVVQVDATKRMIHSVESTK